MRKFLIAALSVISLCLVTITAIELDAHFGLSSAAGPDDEKIIQIMCPESPVLPWSGASLSERAECLGIFIKDTVAFIFSGKGKSPKP